MENSEKRALSVIDPYHPFDYSKQETPPNYKCGHCGATGCKLWRELHTFLDDMRLLCTTCTARYQNKNINDIDKDRMMQTPGDGETYEIGCFVPAVPNEKNNTYWGHKSVPDEGFLWWKKLPIRPS